VYKQSLNHAALTQQHDKTNADFYGKTMQLAKDEADSKVYKTVKIIIINILMPVNCIVLHIQEPYWYSITAALQSVFDNNHNHNPLANAGQLNSFTRLRALLYWCFLTAALQSVFVKHNNNNNNNKPAYASQLNSFIHNRALLVLITLPFPRHLHKNVDCKLCLTSVTEPIIINLLKPVN
jgi:hypothetical protein